MDDIVDRLLTTFETRPAPSPADLASLKTAAAERGFELPADYLKFMQFADGGDGDVGEAWLEIWPVGRVLDAMTNESPYVDVLLLAGDGANVVYGLDRSRRAIVEGDWIGLAQHELIVRGENLGALLASLTREPSP